MLSLKMASPLDDAQGQDGEQTQEPAMLVRLSWLEPTEDDVAG